MVYILKKVSLQSNVSTRECFVSKSVLLIQMMGFNGKLLCLVCFISKVITCIKHKPAFIVLSKI